MEQNDSVQSVEAFNDHAANVIGESINELSKPENVAQGVGVVADQTVDGYINNLQNSAKAFNEQAHNYTQKAEENLQKALNYSKEATKPNVSNFNEIMTQRDNCLKAAERYAAKATAEVKQYILWAGPVIITKYLHESEPLLSDFTDLAVKEDVEDMSSQDADIPYPFRYQIEKWQKEDQ